MGTAGHPRAQICGAPRPKGGRACVHANPPSQALGGPNGRPRHSSGRHSSCPATPDVQRRRVPAGWARAARRARTVGLGEWAAGEVWAPRGRRHRRRGGGGSGGGESLAAASQSAPGRWTAAARVLGLCGSEPVTYPRASQGTRRPEAGGPGGPRDRLPRCASHLALCWNSVSLFSRPFVLITGQVLAFSCSRAINMESTEEHALKEAI